MGVSKKMMILIAATAILADVTLFAAAAPRAKDETNDISSARTPTELASACKIAFRDTDDEDLRRLIADPRDGVSMAAAWERLRRTLAENKEHSGDARVGAEAASRFLGVVEGRLKVRLPGKWESAARSARLDSSGDVSFLERDAAGQDAQTSDEVPAPSIRRQNDRRIIAAGERNWSLPLGNDGGFFDKASLASTDSATYIAVYASWPATGYSLYAVSDKRDSIIWTAKVWGWGDLGGANGTGWHNVAVRPVGDRVIVFGASGEAVYIEIFDAATGKNLGRFGSAYFGARNAARM